MTNFLRISGRVGVVLLSLALLVGVVFAQERSGELTGVATDQSKAVITNVTVTATNKTTDRVITTKTGGDGAFVIRGLEPGRYSVKFEIQGFAPLSFGDVLVVAGRVLTLSASMAVSGTQQSIEVQAEPSMIDTTTTTVGHNVIQEEFNSLPKTRSFQSLAAVSPSANAGSFVEGGIQVNGASGAENQFTVDGLSTNSLIEGQSRQDAAFESSKRSR
jgi:hypothetical protein